MITVIDASVIVKWFFPDPVRESDSNHALAVLKAIRERKAEPLQPPHWLAEVAAVIARLDPGIAEEAADLLDAMEFRVTGDAVIYKRAAVLAAELSHHLFDTLYHAVALEHDATLISADRRYFNKARHLGRIAYLPNWEATQGEGAR
ncbi:MAG: type II toxin-antitoxin system VapC family toxin [Chromatiales bacterium]